MLANLKRYDPFNISDEGYRESAFMGECVNGEFVKFKEAMEASLNSLQQLKAEIANALYDYDDILNSAPSSALDILISKLRQLSAI